MQCYRLAFTLSCLAFALLWGSFPARAAETPELKGLAEAGLKAIAETEYELYSIRGHFASFQELVEAINVNVGAGVDHLLLAKPDTGVYYNVAASMDGRHFIATASFGRDLGGLYIDETGAITSIEKAGSAQGMIDRQRMSDFFADKTQWASQADTMLKLQLHQLQLGLERWSTDHSSKNGDEYPLTLDVIVTAGYVPVGFYCNPVTAWGVDENNAVAVPLGQWSPGNFSYYPYMRDGACKGYMLAGYGCQRTAGVDYNGDGVGDGMALVLASWDGGPAWYKDVLKQVH